MSKNMNKKQVTKKEAGLWVLLPILFAICIIPFVALTKDYETNFAQFVWFNGKELSQIDSFEYAKGVCVVITGIIAACILGFTQYKNLKIKKIFEIIDKRILILAGIYTVMTILSSIFSKYHDLAFTGGGYGQWQTMWVLISYVFIFLYAYLLVDSEKKLNVVLIAFLVSFTASAILGVLQKFGNNPLSWDWVQKIMTSQSQVNGISFKEGYSSVILAFNNPNYTGTYVALITPVILSFVMSKFAKKSVVNWFVRILSVVVTIGLIITLTGSGSSAGAIALCGGVFFAIIFLISSIFTKKEPTGDTEKSSATASSKKRNIIICSVLAVVFVVGGIFASRSSLFQTTKEKILQGDNDTRNIAAIVNEDDKNRLRVEMRNGNTIYLMPEMPDQATVTFKATDEAGTPLEIIWLPQVSRYGFKDNKYSCIEIQPTNFNVNNTVYPGFRFYDAPNAIMWVFMHKDNSWQYYTPFGKFMKLRDVEHFGFKNHQNIANRRGFIWSRTIPLMKKYWFTGVGPNAFIIAFPNDDFVGSKRVGNSTTLVDKPHNTFLQIFIQTGGVSALAYAGLWLILMWESIRIHWRRRPGTTFEWIHFGIFIGMISYAIAGITNDTVIGVQNMYWVILGVGYALTKYIKTSRNN